MKMSKAALPPQQPVINEKDRAHPLFAEYQRHRASCVNQLVSVDAFADWLYQREFKQRADDAAKHPKFQEFQKWMVDNQGGARKCSAGSFPANFRYWLDGGRW